MKREDVAMAKARGGERAENRGRDFSRLPHYFEARVMGVCVDTAQHIETLERECRYGKNGQFHPVEVWRVDQPSGKRVHIGQWRFGVAA